MNTYKAIVKLNVTTNTTTTTNVVVQATDAYKAKLQLEAIYGRKNLIGQLTLVYTKC